MRMVGHICDIAIKLQGHEVNREVKSYSILQVGEYRISE